MLSARPRYVALLCGLLALAIRGFSEVGLAVSERGLVWWAVSGLVGILVPMALWFVISRPALRQHGTLQLDTENRCLLVPARGTAAGFGVAFLGITPVQSLLERVPNSNRIRLSTVPGILPASAVLVLVVIGFALGFILLDRPRVSMNAEGMTLIQYPGRSRHIDWDAVTPGTVALAGRRGPSLTWRQAPESAPGRTISALPTSVFIVDPALLGHAVRTYVDQPDRRAEIGTAAGLARLLAEHAAVSGDPTDVKTKTRTADG